MKVLAVILFCLFINTTQAQVEFYNTLKSNELVQIEKQIGVLELKKETSQTNAYLGALYMKKSNYLKDVKIKIASFKKGNNLLENEIEKNPKNLEYRFLRLAIQENAPKILKYNINIEEDAKFINENFNNSSASLIKIITIYASSSSALYVK